MISQAKLRLNPIALWLSRSRRRTSGSLLSSDAVVAVVGHDAAAVARPLGHPLDGGGEGGGGHEEGGLVPEAVHAVPRPVERVRDGRAQHAAYVHLMREEGGGG